MWGVVFDQLIISRSGIRGVVGSGLNPEVAARYGAAFGTILSRRAGPAGYIVIGRDSRTSGAVLAAAAAAGVQAAGWSIRTAGIAPTPSILLAVQDAPQGAGAVVITASHNPVQWNGLKLAGADGLFLDETRGQEVQSAFDRGPDYADWDSIGEVEPLAGVVDHHIARILALDLVDPTIIAARGLLVALDCVRGAGGVIMPRLLRELGCRVEGIDLEPDGRFPRNPEPVPENLGRLASLVREVGADVGMAVDPDGDRLALVDHTGEPIGEDLTLALAVELVLSRRPGPVVTNLSSSRSIQDAAESGGGSVHRAPVGEANVAARMREVGAVIGGEGNGGVMLPDLHHTRDAPLAATLVLQLLAESGRRLREHARQRKRYHMVKRKASRPSGDLLRAYAALESQSTGAASDRSDGLRLDWEERHEWVHVRPSGTEPVVRLIAEAENVARAEELADWVGTVLRDEKCVES